MVAGGLAELLAEAGPEGENIAEPINVKRGEADVTGLKISGEKVVAKMSDIDREHLFDPFYSGRQAGRGLGFGLSKCWRIVDGHGGRIEVPLAQPGETVFAVFWPADDDSDK